MMSLRTSPRRLGALSSFNPYFRVTNWTAMDELMDEMMATTNQLEGWDNFGWSRMNDQLMWRSAFDDVDAMMANMAVVSPIINRMLAGPAMMDRLQFVSPANEMARLQNETRSMAAAVAGEPPEYFSDVEDVQTGYFRKSLPQAVTGTDQATATPNTLCTMTPHYSIKNWATAKPLMQELINESNKEPGCTYFGWAKTGAKLHSRETFVDGDAMRAHIEAVRPLMDRLSAGPATLERLEINGPSEEVAKVKALTADLNPEYYEMTKQVTGEGATARLEASA